MTKDKIRVNLSIQDADWRLEVTDGIINFFITSNTTVVEVRNVAPHDAEHFAAGLLEAVKRVRQS